MNVIPAVVAGVREIVAVTPPGGVTDAVLAACEIAGVTRLFRIGGAQACAALAYGTATVPRVDKLVGPGNRWVAEAKRQLAGVVGMDMVAGPTEVLIVADAAARPAHVAADLLAQAEHDREASAWLVTPDEELVAAVERELEARLATAPRAGIAREALARNGVAVLVPDLATAITVANRRAPEHLELLVEDADRWLDAVRHAGAVFVGPFTPEPVGDYVAGPSHVLPTGGSARFASPLGVYDFVKRMSVVRYSAARLARDVADVVILARAEGLDGHAEAVLARHPGPR
jgi:histidinol dehydrogenase